MGLFTVGLRDDDFEPAYNDVPDRRDGGRINPYHDRINAQKSCRRMEKTRPELVELARSDTGTRVSWQYGQWRQWAEWKARNEYGDDEGWDALDGNDALRRLLGTGEDRKASQGHGIPTALMYLGDDDAPVVADLETTWYDARRNKPNRSAEWRLYYAACEPIRMARPGDLMCFGMLRDNRLLIVIAQHDSTAEAQAKWLFGIDDEQEGAFRFHDNTERELDAFGAQIFEALGINVEVRDDTYLPEMIGRWGYRFPSNEEFAAFSQSSLTDVDPTHDDPDDVVIEYYDRSYLLFKLYERAVIQHDYDAAPFVSDGVIDVDSFTSFYTSVRNRRMSRAGKVLEIHIAHILDARGIEYRILFLDASDDVLVKRYKETRRTHPLAGLGRVDEGIRKERKALEFLKKDADYILDTSQLLTRELKAELDKIFVQDQKFKNLMITVLSFGFKYGIPADSDLVFDVRFLPNPYYVEGMRPLSGNDAPVRDYVMGFETAQVFAEKLEDMIRFLIPNYISEGKHQLIISIGCTGGKHRSVTLANELDRRLSNAKDYGIRIEHRDLEKDAIRKGI